MSYTWAKLMNRLFGLNYAFVRVAWEPGTSRLCRVVQAHDGSWWLRHPTSNHVWVPIPKGTAMLFPKNRKKPFRAEVLQFPAIWKSETKTKEMRQ